MISFLMSKVSDSRDEEKVLPAFAAPHPKLDLYKPFDDYCPYNPVNSEPFRSETKRKMYDFSQFKRGRHLAVLYGIHIGDSLGVTSEHVNPALTGQLYDKYKVKHTKWPLEFVGDGVNNLWKPGEPSDDTCMALCILKSVSKRKKFSPQSIAKEFIAWYDSGPKDISVSIRAALEDTSRAIKLDNVPSQEAFYQGALELYTSNPVSVPLNGSLMRNGVIPVISMDQPVEVAIEQTILHCLVTHYSPLPVLTCVIHTLLIRHALFMHDNKNSPAVSPTMQDIDNLLNVEWSKFKQQKLSATKPASATTVHPAVAKWYITIGELQLKDAEQQLMQELKSFELFEPYTYDYTSNPSSHCVLSLKIALWALFWSFQTMDNGQVPKWLPKWPFSCRKFETIYWVSLIGADADTYGAIAGSLLAAYHPQAIPAVLVDKLELKDELASLLSHN